MLSIIKVYKKVFSPFMLSWPLIFPVACKFYPTCSVYSQEAVEKYGLFKGFILSFKRILHCHPFHGGGLDLVP